MSYFYDNRDRRRYKTIDINGLTWMAEDLAYKGDDVTFGQPPAGQEWCLYDHANAVKACPPGWRLPTREEWQALAQGDRCCDKIGRLRLWARGYMADKQEWHIPKEMVCSYYWCANASGQWSFFALRTLGHAVFMDSMMDCYMFPVRCVCSTGGTECFITGRA